MTEEEKIRQAVRSHILFFGGTLEPTLGRVVIYQGFALCEWTSRHPGGLAALKLVGTTWTVISGGGGRPSSTAELVALGMSEAIASYLLAQS